LTPGLRFYLIPIFPLAHETPPHVHTTAHELFFILAGEGVAFCNVNGTLCSRGIRLRFRRLRARIDTMARKATGCLELMPPNDVCGVVQAGELMDT
jgi:hypothetical protein